MLFIKSDCFKCYFSVFCYETWRCYDVTGVQGVTETMFQFRVENIERAGDILRSARHLGLAKSMVLWVQLHLLTFVY